MLVSRDVGRPRIDHSIEGTSNSIVCDVTAFGAAAPAGEAFSETLVRAISGMPTPPACRTACRFRSAPVVDFLAVGTYAASAAFSPAGQAAPWHRLPSTSPCSTAPS